MPADFSYKAFIKRGRKHRRIIALLLLVAFLLSVALAASATPLRAQQSPVHQTNVK